MLETYCPKKWGVVSVVLAALYGGLDYVIHNIMLHDAYMATAHLWRTGDAIQSTMCVAFLGYVIFGVIFSAIYAHGYNPTKSGTSQGIRFGLIMGIFYWGCHLLLAYPYNPWPDHLYRTWFGVGLAEFVLLGLVCGAIYKPR
jgi:hypothetical protein